MRALVSFALALAMATPLLAQIDAGCLRIARWGERGNPQALAAEGSRFWAADGRGITVYDTRGEVVRAGSSVRTSSPSIDLALPPAALVVLTRGSLELWSRDASGPIARIGSVATEGDLLAAWDSTVVTAAERIEVFEITAAGIELRATTSLPRRASAIDLRGDRLFVAIAGFGSFEYQIGAGSIELLRSHPADAVDVAATDGAVYFAAKERGIIILDRASGAVSSILDDRSHWIDRLTIDGERLVVTDRDRIVSLDISNPLAPRIESAFPQQATAIASSANTLCAARSTRVGGYPVESETALRCWSRDGADLRPAGAIEGLAGPVGGVAIAGQYAFVADPPRLRVLDLSNPAAPVEVTSIDHGGAEDRIRIRGSLAIVYGRGDTHLFDISNPRAPIDRGAHRSGGIPPSGADFAGALIAEANRGTGLHIMSPDPASWPTQIGGRRHPGNGQMYGVVGYDGYIYSLIAGGVLVMEISNPAEPVLGKFLTMGNPVDGLILEANGSSPRLLVISQNDRLRVFDLTTLANPLEIGSVEVGPSSLLSATGNIIWASSPTGRVDRVDLSTPAAPLRTHTVTGFLEPGQATAANGLLLVADRWGVEVLRDPSLEVTTPAILSNEVSPAGRLARVRWSGGAAPWIVHSSSSASFEGASEFVTGTPALTLPLDGTRWVRVGARSSCGEVIWSAPVEIRLEDGIRFTGGDRTIVVSESDFPLELTLGVRNSSASAAPPSLDPLPAGVRVIDDGPIGAGAEGALRLELSASAPRELTLRLAETGSRVRVRLLVTQAQSASPQPGADVILPGAASAPGARQTRWESDVHLFCRTGACNPRLTFVPARSDQEARSVTLPLDAGESLRVDRIVASLFGYFEATGHIRVHSAGEIEAWATTWNDSPNGRFGQRIPGFRSNGATGSRWLAGLRHDELYRTNIGLVETSGQPREVTLTLFDAEGLQGISVPLQLRPWEASQQTIESMFGGSIPSGSSVRVDAQADVIAWTSRVDQRTGDASFSYATPLGSEGDASFTYGADVVGSAPGAEGSNWKTNLTLTNPGDATAHVRLTYLGGAEAESAEIEIAARATYVADDLFGLLFPHLGATTGPMRIISSAPLSGSLRIYNDTSGGTWGQSVPLRELRRGASELPGEIFLVGGSEEQRVNVGIVETSGRAADAQIRVLDQRGELLTILPVRLEPLGSFTMLAALETLGVSGPARLEIAAPAGVTAWASVVENRTGDAIFLDGR